MKNAFILSCAKKTSLSEGCSQNIDQGPKANIPDPHSCGFLAAHWCIFGVCVSRQQSLFLSTVMQLQILAGSKPGYFRYVRGSEFQPRVCGGEGYGTRAWGRGCQILREARPFQRAEPEELGVAGRTRAELKKENFYLYFKTCRIACG